MGLRHRTVKLFPVVLVCPACGATYNIGMSLLMAPPTLPRWSYAITPEQCTACGEPLNVPTLHRELRDTAANLVIAAAKREPACKCGHAFEEHDLIRDDASDCLHRLCECTEYRPDLEVA